MGDGRYYTLYQFFGVMILVIISMIVMVSIVIEYFRKTEKYQERQLLYMQIMLESMIIMKIVEFVIPNIHIAYYLRLSVSMLLFVCLLSCMRYLNESIFHIIEFQNKYLWGVVIAFMAFASFYAGGRYVISSYHFFDIQYSIPYVWAWALVSIYIFIYLFIIFVTKKPLHVSYSNHFSAFIMFVFIWIPMTQYVVNIVMRSKYMDYAEIFAFAMLTIAFHIIIYSQSPSGVTLATFNRIGELIKDYVIVMDRSGRIIYKNNRVMQSHLFAEKDIIDLEAIENIYAVSTLQLFNQTGQEYIKAECEKGRCFFTQRLDEIYDQNKVIGYMLTIVDISELVELQELLESIKEKEKLANKRLKSQAEVVYNLERQKEIILLLDQILESRESDMLALIHKIDELISKKLRDDYVIENLNQIIVFNQNVLAEVRKTVSEYR